MPISLQAGLWGLLGGAALLVGAVVGYFVRVPPRLVAVVMAFGSGVLISALAFELMDEAYRQGGFPASAAGFLGGAVVYTLANVALSRGGAKARKRSGSQQPSEAESGGSGLAIALGALLVISPNPILLVILVFGALELWNRWRDRGTAAATAYYTVERWQRGVVAVTYIGLAVFTFAISAIFALLNLITGFLVGAGARQFGPGSILAVLWSGFAPVTAVVVLALVAGAALLAARATGGRSGSGPT